ncbi:hypothetical protein [Telluria beijingensis]|uniref:hypothetical protein n=1 Tax=Telluria beijingensis TaxID=3068633 RepID=UPI002795303B|nr:hypothetical protein [Massilia sp. REN29]
MHLLLGCDMRERHHDASAEPHSRNALGARYVVVGPLDAYGVRQDPQAPVEHVTLIPPPGVDGPEVDFRMPVPMGATVTVLKVMRTNRLFDPEMTFIVALEGAALPVNAPVRIDLFRGNEGEGRLQLNPAIYRRLPAP